MRVFSYSKLFLLLLGLSMLSQPAAAQRRDYLNEKEADLVRENQQIDLRIDVLIKAADRRFMVLDGAPEGKKDWEKASDLWGEMPVGPQPALYSDINKLLQKAVDDIDDVAAHNRMDSKFFPKAVRALGSSADKYLPRLKIAFEKTKDEKEKGSLIGAIELCEQILEAVAKLPPDVKETKKDKKDKKPNS